MDYASISDIGLYREKNQDSYCAVSNIYGDLLLCVADGIGGGKAGEVASSEVVKYFIDKFKNSEKFESIAQAEEYMRKLICDANLEVFKLSCKYRQYQGMGTTVTGILKSEAGVISFNVGDSRVYGYADGKSFHLTQDHTLVNEMLAKGEITYEESLTHPKRHYLVKAVGVWDVVKPDIHQVAVMDNYLVCSDGLSSYSSDEEIRTIMVKENLSAKEKCDELLQLALYKGGYDNITIVVLNNNG